MHDDHDDTNRYRDDVQGHLLVVCHRGDFLQWSPVYGYRKGVSSLFSRRKEIEHVFAVNLRNEPWFDSVERQQ